MFGEKLKKKAFSLWHVIGVPLENKLYRVALGVFVLLCFFWFFVSLETEWMQGLPVAPTLCICCDHSHRMTLQQRYPQSGLHALLRTRPTDVDSV